MATTARNQEIAAQTRASPGRKLNITPYLFILPHLLAFAVFIGYPFFNGLYISFLQYDFLRPLNTRFVGLQNYVNLFTPGSV